MIGITTILLGVRSATSSWDQGAACQKQTKKQVTRAFRAKAEQYISIWSRSPKGTLLRAHVISSMVELGQARGCSMKFMAVVVEKEVVVVKRLMGLKYSLSKG